MQFVVRYVKQYPTSVSVVHMMKSVSVKLRRAISFYCH